MLEGYVSAEEACRLLSVSKATVYSYVSRGKLRSQGVPGSKERKYWLPDIASLTKGEKKTNPLAGSSAAESSITLITDSGHFYRGKSALQLADEATLEDVAGILWDVDPASNFGNSPETAPPLFHKLCTLLNEQSDVDRATAVFPLLEQANMRSYDLSRLGMARTGAKVLRWLTAIILRRSETSQLPIHETFAESLNLDSGLSDLVRRILVLSADHAFEPGTLAVRAVASTGVTPWRAVLTGLSVSSGRQSRSRHSGETARFVQQILSSDHPAADVVRRLRDGETLPGFSSPAYTEGDPRGEALLKICAQIFSNDTEFKRLDAALAAVRDITGQRPGFALANMFAGHKLGLARSYAPFVVGRACGWIAHAIEQLQFGEIERGSPSYKGPLPQPATGRMD